MAFKLWKKTTNIDFVGFRFKAYIISVIILLAGIMGFVLNGGLRYGVDFAGGYLIQVQFEKGVPDEQVKAALNGFNLPGLTVQQSGMDNTDYMLRFSASTNVSDTLRAELVQALSFADNKVDIPRMEMVGPKAGADLRNMAVEALYYSVLLITVYISGRFEKRWFVAAGVAAVLWGAVWLTSFVGFSRVWGVAIALCIAIGACYKLKLNFALGAIASLLHDVVTTLGILTLMGKEIDLNIIAALLTLVGYSLNDTIIVYDRIRENLRNALHQEPKPAMGDLINLSVNQTLSRTVLTSGTTLAACLSLYLLGGSVIHDFALTMLMGVFVGTYSSVFVASPILMAVGNTQSYLHQQETAVTSFEKPGEHGVV